jgi:heme oxygenase
VALNPTELVVANQGLAEGRAPRSAIDRLRKATRSAHSQIDQNLRLVDRFNSVRERDQLLAGYHFLHRLTENEVAPFLSAMSDLEFSARCRSTLIAEAIRVSCREVLPDDSAALRVLTRAEAFGALYVIEGSSLGGRVILKELKRRKVSLAGLRFLDPYGHQTAARWKAFLTVLGREVKSGEQDGRRRPGSLKHIRFRPIVFVQREYQLNVEHTELTGCDREPIHIPGSIQPHGVMLAVERAGLIVRYVAGDVEKMLGSRPDIDGPLADFVGHANAETAELGSKPASRPAFVGTIEKADGSGINIRRICRANISNWNQRPVLKNRRGTCGHA